MAYKAPYELACAPVPITTCHPSPPVFGQFLEHSKCQVLSCLENFVLPISCSWNAFPLAYHIFGPFLAECLFPGWSFLSSLSKVDPSIVLYHNACLIDWSQLTITYLLICCLRSGSLGIDPKMRIQVQAILLRQQSQVRQVSGRSRTGIWKKENMGGISGKATASMWSHREALCSINSASEFIPAWRKWAVCSYFCTSQSLAKGHWGWSQLPSTYHSIQVLKGRLLES